MLRYDKVSPSLQRQVSDEIFPSQASNGNVPEMEMHMAGLKELVQLFGGMDTLDLPTIAFLTG